MARWVCWSGSGSTDLSGPCHPSVVSWCAARGPMLSAVTTWLYFMQFISTPSRLVLDCSHNSSEATAGVRGGGGERKEMREDRRGEEEEWGKEGNKREKDKKRGRKKMRMRRERNREKMWVLETWAQNWTSDTSAKFFESALFTGLSCLLNEMVSVQDFVNHKVS